MRHAEHQLTGDWLDPSPECSPDAPVCVGSSLPCVLDGSLLICDLTSDMSVSCGSFTSIALNDLWDDDISTGAAIAHNATIKVI